MADAGWKDVHIDPVLEPMAGGLKAGMHVSAQTSPIHAFGDTDSPAEAVEPPDEPCPKRMCGCPP